MEHENFAAGNTSLPDVQVYIVDDDQSIREALSALLSSVGLPVRSFESADEFLAAEMPEVPSCLILDLWLEGSSGPTLQQISFRGAIRFPIVFLTAHDDIEMSVEAMKAGAFDFMTKPFNDQELIDTITAALEKDREFRRQQNYCGYTRSL